MQSEINQDQKNDSVGKYATTKTWWYEFNPWKGEINVAKLSSDLHTYICIIHRIIKSSTPKYLLLEQLWKTQTTTTSEGREKKQILHTGGGNVN